MPTNDILTQWEAAQLLSLSEKTLQAWRYKGEGPKFLEPRPRVIRYLRSDVIEWLTSKSPQENGGVPNES